MTGERLIDKLSATTLSDEKFVFLSVALSYLNQPYKWGGDDPTGIDCSGLVVECLASAGMVGEWFDATADMLMHRFNATTTTDLQPGSLIWRVNDKNHATHVMISLGKGWLIEAGGGHRGVTTEGEAAKANAFVRIRNIKRENFDNLRYADPF